MTMLCIPALKPPSVYIISPGLLVKCTHPASVKNMWEEVTCLKYAATGASHSKFPEVFASRRRQSMSFVSALMVMYSLSACACGREKKHTEIQKKERPKWRKPENLNQNLLYLPSMCTYTRNLDLVLHFCQCTYKVRHADVQLGTRTPKLYEKKK